MRWTVKVSSRAEKRIRKLGRTQRKQVIEALRVLAQMANPRDDINVRPLSGELRGLFRLRVGDYRIIFGLLTAERTIAVVHVAPRGDVYKN